MWSLITVTYNSREAIDRCWRAKRPDDVEWIVLDNASSDDSADLCETLGARVIRSEANLGFAAGNNRAMEAATGEFIAFVNPDVRLDPAQLDLLAAELATAPGLVAPQLLNADGTAQPNGRSYPTVANKFRGRLGMSAERFYCFAEPGQIREVVWITGAFVAMPKRLYDAGLAWDERFFVYYEDVDLSIRSWKQGHPVRVVGDARMVHEWARDTSGGLNLAAWKRELTGMRKFYGKFPTLATGLTASSTLDKDFRQ